MSTLDYYNANAEKFVSGSINADVSELYERFLKFIPEKASILDLGCGSGRDTAYFRRLEYSVTPIDGSKEICELAEAFLRTPVRCITFQELDYTDSFDAVWACASLLHVEKKDMISVLSKVRQALKPEGILYASYKYGEEETQRDGRYFSNYTENSIRELFPSSEWVEKDIWVSSDVRPGRESERWINIITCKN